MNGCSNFTFCRLFPKIEIFKGKENIVTMSQTHSKKFHCTYLLHYYPFDTQICKVDLQVEEFVKSNVELLPDNMELLTDTELTQYYLQSWTLDFNDLGNVRHLSVYNEISKIISFRFTLRWVENGDYIQAATDQ